MAPDRRTARQTTGRIARSYPDKLLDSRVISDFQEIANFIRSIADEVLRDDFNRGKYRDVILPFTVLRRLGCVLAPTKERVLKRYEDLKAKGFENMDGQLRRAAGHSLSPSSRSTAPP